MLLVGVFKGWEGAKSFLQPSRKSHVNVFVSLIRWEQSSITKIFLWLKKKLSPLEGDAGNGLVPTQTLSVPILTISRETSRHHCHQCASVSLALLSIHAVMIMCKLLTLLTWENFLSPEIHPISRELEIQMGRNHTLCVNTADLIKAAVNHIGIKGGGGTFPCHQVHCSPTIKEKMNQNKNLWYAACPGQHQPQALIWSQLWSFFVLSSVATQKSCLVICLARLSAWAVL